MEETTPAHLTAADFEEFIATTADPVLVDFWAEWCGPCRMMSPVLDEVAAETGGRLAVVKLDVDTAPEVARRYNVLSIPTLIVLRDGVEEMRLVGALPKHDLLAALDRYL